MPFYTQKQLIREAQRRRLLQLRNNPEMLARLVRSYRIRCDMEAATEKRGRRVRFNEARREAITYRRRQREALAA